MTRTRIYTATTFAKKVGLSPREIRRKCEKGIIDTAYKEGYFWLIPVEEEEEVDND